MYSSSIEVAVLLNVTNRKLINITQNTSSQCAQLPMYAPVNQNNAEVRRTTKNLQPKITVLVCTLIKPLPQDINIRAI